MWSSERLIYELSLPSVDLDAVAEVLDLLALLVPAIYELSLPSVDLDAVAEVLNLLALLVPKCKF